MAEKQNPWLQAWNDDKKQDSKAKGDSKGMFPIHYAASRGNSRACQLLASNGCDVDCLVGDRMWSPVHFAAREAQILTLWKLIQLGAEPEITDRYSFTCADILCEVLGVAREKRPKRLKEIQQLQQSIEQFSDEFEENEEAEADEEETEENQKRKNKEKEEDESRTRELFTWGDGSNMQLCNGSTDNKSEPRKVRTLNKSEQPLEVVMSSVHTLICTRSGSVYSNGFGLGGRLGHDDEISLVAPRLINFGQKVNIIQVCASDNLSGFLSDIGELYSCGRKQLIPLKVVARSSGLIIKQASVGSEHYAIITIGGSLCTWGTNSEGQLGIGSLENQTSPRIVPYFSKKERKAISVKCGEFHTVVLTNNGAVFQCGGKKPFPKKIVITEAYEKPDEGFELVCREGKRQAKTVISITAGGKQSACVSSSGIVHRWSATNFGATVVPIGKKTARSIAIADGKLAVITETGSLIIAYDSKNSPSTTSPPPPKTTTTTKSTTKSKIFPVILRNVQCIAVSPKCFAAIVIGSKPMEITNFVPAKTLCKDLEHLINPSDFGTFFSDIVVKCSDGGKLKAHKVLLSRCSKLSLSEQEIIIPATNKNALIEFVRFVYTGEEEVSGKYHSEIMHLSEELGLFASKNKLKTEYSISKHLWDMKETGEFSDVIVSCDSDPNTIYHLHRSILACRCEFFSAMLSSGMEEDSKRNIVLRDLNSIALSALIEFIYTDSHGKFNQSSICRIENELEILLLSDQMLLNALGKLCLNAISSMIDSENVISIAEIAERSSQQLLRRLCIDYILQNPSLIVCSGFLDSLSESILNEMQAIAFQKAEATTNKIISMFGPSLSKPSEIISDDEEDENEQLSSATIPTTPKKKSKKKKARSQTPHPAISTTTPNDLFWESTSTTETLTTKEEESKGEEKMEKNKKKKEKEENEVEEIVDEGVATVLIGSEKGKGRIGSDEQRAQRNAETLISEMTKKKNPWKPTQTTKRHTVEEIQREEQQKQQSTTNKSTTTTTATNKSTTVNAGSGRKPIVVNLSQAIENKQRIRGSSPSPTRTVAWQSPQKPQAQPEQQQKQRRSSLAEIQQEQIKETPQKLPTRRWEASPHPKGLPPEYLVDIIITEEERAKLNQ